MQAMKFIFKSLCAGLVAVLLLSGCGEKTPEQIAAENQKALEIAVKRAQVLMFEGKYEECAGTLEEASRNYGTNAALCELLAYRLREPRTPQSFLKRRRIWRAAIPRC